MVYVVTDNVTVTVLEDGCPFHSKGAHSPCEDKSVDVCV